MPVKQSRFIPFHDGEVHQIVKDSLEEIECIRTLIKDQFNKKQLEVSMVRREGVQVTDRYVVMRRKLE